MKPQTLRGRPTKSGPALASRSRKAAASGPNPVARISVVSSIGYFANLAGPPAVGALAQAAGLLNALWVIVVLFVAAGNPNSARR